MDEVAPVSERPGLFNLGGLVQSEEERAHRRLAYAKYRPIGVPYCEQICEYEPDKEIEIAEGFAMATFTVDYLGRLATAHAVPYRVIDPDGYAKNRDLRHYEPNGCWKTIRYFFTFIMLVDFFALAPYYFKTITERLLPEFASSEMMRAMRLVRITRVLPFYMHMVVSTKGVLSQGDRPHFMRLFDLGVVFNFLRLGDYAEGAPLFFSTLRASMPAITVAIVAMLCLTMMFGTAIYLAEHGTFKVTPEYPEGAFLVQKSQSQRELVEPAHANIFMSMWYIVSDTTTMPTIRMLGPVTVAGEVLDVMVDYMSLIVLTLPIAIIARNFHEQYESFFRNWDLDDIDWSSDEEEEEDGKKEHEVDDFDMAIAKLEAAQEVHRMKMQELQDAKDRRARQKFGFERRICLQGQDGQKSPRRCLQHQVPCHLGQGVQGAWHQRRDTVQISYQPSAQGYWRTRARDVVPVKGLKTMLSPFALTAQICRLNVVKLSGIVCLQAALPFAQQYGWGGQPVHGALNTAFWVLRSRR